MNLFEGLSKTLKQGTELAKKGAEIIAKQTEKSIKIESLKADITTEKKQLDKKMKRLASRIYSMYEKNEIEDPELIEMCKEIKKIKWNIEKKYSEIETIRKTTVSLKDEPEKDPWEDDEENFFENSDDEDKEKIEETPKKEEIEQKEEKPKKKKKKEKKVVKVKTKKNE